MTREDFKLLINKALEEHDPGADFIGDDEQVMLEIICIELLSKLKEQLPDEKPTHVKMDIEVFCQNDGFNQCLSQVKELLTIKD